MCFEKGAVKSCMKMKQQAYQLKVLSISVERVSGKQKNKVKRSLPVIPRKQKLIVKIITKEYGLIGS